MTLSEGDLLFVCLFNLFVYLVMFNANFSYKVYFLVVSVDGGARVHGEDHLIQALF